MKSFTISICFLLVQLTCTVRALDQDLQVYPDGNTFIVRGQLDNEIIQTFPDASEAIQHGIECKRTIVLNIIGCLVFQAKEYAYYLRASSNSVLISGCRTFQIEKHAIVVENSHEANINGNIFCWHRGHGIVFTGSAWATVTCNNIFNWGDQVPSSSPIILIITQGVI